MGFALFGAFWGMEWLADAQKMAFKSKPGNAGKFMKEGLFKYCQFPHYLAEVGMSFAVWLAALPVLAGSKQQWAQNRLNPRQWNSMQWCSAIAPLYAYVLMIHGSGIPNLESGWEEKYGQDPEFQHWRQHTNKVIPGRPAPPFSP